MILHAADSHCTLTMTLDTLAGRVTPGRVILQVYTPEALLLMLVSVTDTGVVLISIGGSSSSVVLLDQL